MQVTRLCCHLSLKPSPGTELYLYKNIIKIFTGVRETATQRVIERKRRRRQSGDEEILLLCLSLPKADNWRPRLDSGSKRRAEKERRRSDRGQRGERQRERIREREATSTCMTHSLSLLLLCNSSSKSLSHSHCQRGQTELRAAVFPKYSTTGTIYFTWVTLPVSAIWVVVAVNHHWCTVPRRQLCEDKLYTHIQLCLLLICSQGKLRQTWGACLASKYIRVCLC